MEKLIVVRTAAQLDVLAQYLADKDFVAFDTETTGLTRDSQVVGLSVCADPEEAYYVIIKYWDVPTQKLVEVFTAQAIRAWLQSLKGKKLIAHNAPFDCSMIEANFDVALMPDVHTDTAVLAHLLDENRSNALKELGTALFGEGATTEQQEAHASVRANGGLLTRDKYELYKADPEPLARYGAKDTILTLKVFYVLVPQLYEEGLDKFFYEEESMPLLRGPTYDLNTTGLKVNVEKLQDLRNELEVEALELLTYINKEIAPHVQEKYPGTSKSNTFNVGSGQQLAWLLFVKLGQPFHRLTDAGKEVCKALGLKIPYSFKAKREFLQVIADSKDHVYAPEGKSLKTGKVTRAKKVGEVQKYLSTDAETLELFANKYTWVQKLLEYSKGQTILNTFVMGIQNRTRYGVIRPSFNQSGTTSGRYSSKEPNFQNLPRNDKRVKACIQARPGKIFVGADYSQLEPRVFASITNDPKLTQCFADGDDFYSVVGVDVFGLQGLSLKKDEKGSFADKHPLLREKAKELPLAYAYGTTAPKMAPLLDKDINETQEILDRLAEAFPGIPRLQERCHTQVKAEGRVLSLYGRPRRIPEAMDIPKIYGNTPHKELPYQVRTLLNLSVNHRVQSTGASIMNRAAIEVKHQIDIRGWGAVVKIVLQVHDELVLECPEELADEVAAILKLAMETTTLLPNVALVAKPVKAFNLADLK